ncbi:MAG: sigma-54-dependent Fis family transcriptional regulator [Deltaproteobacteria bacterium]|nr:sigma-54-dependent Fis family transcriptional regulator [Deltaproteobacteria bacterium]
MARVLIVDDEERMRHLLSIMLSRRGYQTEQAGDGQEALERLSATPFDMVITDIRMPRMDGMELLSRVQKAKISCPVIFITAFATVESAVEAMRAGAIDYITKPFEEERIVLTVERTLNVSKLMAENRELRQELQRVAGAQDIIYRSQVIHKVVELSARVAQTDSAVLIRGESGTGKELIARYIHNESSRKAGRFVPVNCAAISSTLVESELFGYDKGAFTGADKRAIGKFEYANGGTLFLDEIGDLPLEAQAKFLRALQEKKFQRVGGNEEISVDGRVICATNQNLDELVQTGKFRQDLFYRINVFPLQIPPLREHMDDVMPLVEYYLKRFDRSCELKLTEGAVRVLQEYRWPGNVRELANAVERSVILAQGTGAITADTLSFIRKDAVSSRGKKPFSLPPEGISLEDVEKDLACQALEQAANNQSAAARLLGLTRAKFRVLMKQIEERSSV